MKKILFLMMAALVIVGCGKEDDGLNTEIPPTTDDKYDVTVDLKMPGTLASNIPNKEFKTIKIKGELNGTDIKFIRGIISNISIIDLEDANIVEGGESYFNITNKTKNNVIGKYMFTELEGQFDIKLPKSVTLIEDYAFSESNGLHNITIGENVSLIKNEVFRGCENLNKITLPNKTQTIGMSSFGRCLNLKEVILSTNITSIESNTFYNCQKLESILFPVNIKKIDSQAFVNCYSLKSIEIPNNVNEIGMSAFMDCTNLESVYISKNVTKLEIQTFRGCNKLKNVHCYAKTPPIIGSEINNQQDFSTFPNNIENLYIPIGTLELYKNSSWKKFFKNIIEE